MFNRSQVQFLSGIGFETFLREKFNSSTAISIPTVVTLILIPHLQQSLFHNILICRYLIRFEILV